MLAPQLLKALGDVYGIAHYSVVDPPRGTDIAHHGGAGMQAAAEPQRQVAPLPALSIVESTVGNSVIAKALREAKERVTDGSSISRPLAQDGVFPPLLTDMLAVGEESGDIAGALAHIGLR